MGNGNKVENEKQKGRKKKGKGMDERIMENSK